MKEPLLDLHLSKGLGDTISSTPTLRKLFFAYGRKISVLTDHPYIFKNNKYVDIPPVSPGGARTVSARRAFCKCV